MKREYELTFVLRIDAPDEGLTEQIDEVKGWIQGEGLGEVKKMDRWGRRRLAYEIDKQREGIYIYFEAEMDPKNVGELERNLRLATHILRHLIVLKDE
ncbi:MAG: 30S ribosomal protein S6 [Armatimonadetes bacterium]|nr:30S ribosomal protein S6 [Anaerolineae bacterium]